MVTIVTIRHIVLEFRSEGANSKEINEIANAKLESVLEDIGRSGITGKEKGKEVYWNAKKG
jgi:hypothetical protein